MNLQISVLVVLVTGISLIGLNILINSVSALPAVKIGLPSRCELIPSSCTIIAFPKIDFGLPCPPVCPVLIDKDLKDFKPEPWPMIQKLKANESLIVIPFAGNTTALVMTVPTKDIQISNTTQNQ